MSAENGRDFIPAADTFFSEKGWGQEVVLSDLQRLLAQNRGALGFAFYDAGLVYPESISFGNAIKSTGGRETLSSYAFQGTSGYLEAGILAMSKDFFGCESPYRTGQTLLTGTTALQQVLHLAISRYYTAQGHSYNEKGHTSGSTPVVLAPVHAKFLVQRILNTAGLGHRNARYYGLTESYDTDFDDLERVLRQIRSEGTSICLNYILGGDTARGLVQDVNRITQKISKYCEEHNAYSPCTVVDGTAHAFNLWAQARQNELGFSTERIDALVVNPQKAGFDLGGTILFLQDGRQLGSIVDQNLDLCDPSVFANLRQRLQAVATNLTSRDGTPTMSFFATLQSQGLDWFRSERLRVLHTATRLRELIKMRRDLFELLPCDNTIVSFYVRGKNSRNWELAQKINNAGIPGRFINFASDLRLRYLHQTSPDGYEYSGLWANIYPHHTNGDIEDLFRALCQETEAILQA